MLKKSLIILIGLFGMALLLSSCNFGRAISTPVDDSGNRNAGNGNNDSGVNDVSINTKRITVSWTANREQLVNTAGGGYTIYYSTQSNAALGSATSVNVPYASGASAPTSTVLELPSGVDYYFRVVAYSTLGGEIFTSIPSTEQFISLK